MKQDNIFLNIIYLNIYCTSKKDRPIRLSLTNTNNLQQSASQMAVVKVKCKQAEPRDDTFKNVLKNARSVSVSSS